MEVLASYKSLVKNGIMVRLIAYPAQQSRECAFDDIETWEEIPTLFVMYIEIKKKKKNKPLITNYPRLQASKH